MFGSSLLFQNLKIYPFMSLIMGFSMCLYGDLLECTSFSGYDFRHICFRGVLSCFCTSLLPQALSSARGIMGFKMVISQLSVNDCKPCPELPNKGDLINWLLERIV